MDERRMAVMEAQVKSTCETVDTIAMRVSSIDNTLRGNGNPGLLSKHTVLEKRVAHLEEFTGEMKRMRTWITTGVFAVLGSLVWSAVQTVMRGG